MRNHKAILLALLVVVLAALSGCAWDNSAEYADFAAPAQPLELPAAQALVDDSATDALREYLDLPHLTQAAWYAEENGVQLVFGFTNELEEDELTRVAEYLGDIYTANQDADDPWAELPSGPPPVYARCSVLVDDELLAQYVAAEGKLRQVYENASIILPLRLVEEGSAKSVGFRGDKLVIQRALNGKSLLVQLWSKRTLTTEQADALVQELAPQYSDMQVQASLQLFANGQQYYEAELGIYRNDPWYAWRIKELTQNDRSDLVVKDIESGVLARPVWDWGRDLSEEEWAKQLASTPQTSYEGWPGDFVLVNIGETSPGEDMPELIAARVVDSGSGAVVKEDALYAPAGERPRVQLPVAAGSYDIFATVDWGGEQEMMAWRVSVTAPMTKDAVIKHFFNAEQLYAQCRGYARMELGDSQMVNGQRYYRVTDTRLTTKQRLGEYLYSYFPKAQAEELLYTQIELLDASGKHDLFTDIDGCLYMYGGYASQYKADSVTRELGFAWTGKEEITIKGSFYWQLDSHSDLITLNRDYTYKIDGDNRWRFTDFELPLVLILESAEL